MKDKEVARTNLKLYCGVDTGIDAGDYPYEYIIKTALDLNSIEGIEIEEFVFDRKLLKLNAGSGLILRKDAMEFIFTDQITNCNFEIKNNNVYLNLSGDPVTGVGSFLEKQFEIPDLVGIKNWRLDEIEFDDNNQIESGSKSKISRFNIAKQFGSTYKDIGDLPFPPICCFDGVNFKKATELEEEYSPIITKYENRLIEIYKTTGYLRKNEHWPYIIGQFFGQQHNNLSPRRKQDLIGRLTPKNTQTLEK